MFVREWQVEIYNESVEEAILNMPPKIQARMIKLLELIEKHGANLGPPHTEPPNVASIDYHLA